MSVPDHLKSDKELLDDVVFKLQHTALRIEVGEPPFVRTSERLIFVDGFPTTIAVYRNEKLVNERKWRV